MDSTHLIQWISYSLLYRLPLPCLGWCSEIHCSFMAKFSPKQFVLSTISTSPNLSSLFFLLSNCRLFHLLLSQTLLSEQSGTLSLIPWSWSGPQEARSTYALSKFHHSVHKLHLTYQHLFQEVAICRIPLFLLPFQRPVTLSAFKFKIDKFYHVFLSS